MPNLYNLLKNLYRLGIKNIPEDKLYVVVFILLTKRIFIDYNNQN